MKSLNKMMEFIMSIGKFAQTLILANPNMTNTEVLGAIKLAYPEAKTSMACIAWYKSDLRKKGSLAPRAAQPASVEDQIKFLEAKLEELKAKQVPAPIEKPKAEEPPVEHKKGKKQEA